MTEPNQFFGWIHSFKIDEFSPIFANGSLPPPIRTSVVSNPGFKQTLYNWNLADTGLMFFTIAGTVGLTVRYQKKFPTHNWITAQK